MILLTTRGKSISTIPPAVALMSKAKAELEAVRRAKQVWLAIPHRGWTRCWLSASCLPFETKTCACSQESKETYQREKEIKRARDAQFLDDFKRAILLDGGYVAALGPEPVHEQVEVLFDDASGSKVRQVPLPQGGGGAAGTSRLMAMKAAFDEGGDEEEDDEWDPVQLAREASNDSSGSDTASSPPRRQEPTPLAAPRNREEERAMLARAMRESHEVFSGRDRRSQADGGRELSIPSSARHSSRPSAAQIHAAFGDIEEADPAPRPGTRPLPPPAVRRDASRKGDPPQGQDERASERSVLDEDRERFIAEIIERKGGTSVGGRSRGEADRRERGDRGARSDRQWV